MRRRAGAALIAAATLRGSGAAAGDWTFTPGMSVDEIYDSNVLYVNAAPTPDLITSLGVDLPVGWAGRAQRLSLEYRPVYRHYMENSQFDSLSHTANLRWDGEGGRTRWNVTGNFGRTEDPRGSAGQASSAEATEPTATEPTAPELGFPFFVERGASTYYLVSAGVDRSLSHRWTLSAEVEGSVNDFGGSIPVDVSDADRDGIDDSLDPDPTDACNPNPCPQGSGTFVGLTDTHREGFMLDAGYVQSTRNSWSFGYRFDRFGGTNRPTSSFGAVQGGGAHVLARSLSLNWGLGVIAGGEGIFKLAVDCAEVGTGDGVPGCRGSRLFGSFGLSGTGTPVRWSLAYSRDFGSGGGVAAVVRNESAQAEAGFEVSRSGSLTASAMLSRSRGVGLDVDSRTASLRYSHALPDGWSASFSAAVTDQDSLAPLSGAGRTVGTFSENTFTAGFRYAPRGVR